MVFNLDWQGINTDGMEPSTPLSRHLEYTLTKILFAKKIILSLVV